MAGEGAGQAGEPAARGGAAAAAGWYPDPQYPGRYRYWDGAAWTGHVHPPEAPGEGGPQPHGGGAAPAGEGPQPHGGGVAPAEGGPSPHTAAGAPPYAGGTPPYPSGWHPGWAAAKAESDARQWATFAHLSALLALVVGLPWLGPLVIYLVKKNAHPFIEGQAREALNFNLSVFIYEIVTVVAIFVLAIVLIGFLLIPVAIGIAIAWLVLVIVAAVKANSGQPYRYPLTIRMVT